MAQISGKHVNIVLPRTAAKNPNDTRYFGISRRFHRWIVMKFHGVVEDTISNILTGGIVETVLDAVDTLRERKESGRRKKEKK